MSDTSSKITLRILDGSDRGKTFSEIEAPITIGREDGNTIQLNDERVSRFHAKIQQDHEQIVLTDLESTNGTKVNGEEIQLRILRFGDLLSIGRSVLLFGSREQINDRLATLRENQKDDPTGSSIPGASGSSYDMVMSDAELQAAMFDLDPPTIPERLTPGQAAQLSELMEFLHIRMRSLVRGAEPLGESVSFKMEKWQELLDLHARISEYISQIGNPE